MLKVMLFSTMTIRARLILAFAILFGLFLAVTTASLHRLDGLITTTQRIVNSQARQAHLAENIHQHAQAESIILFDLLRTPARDDRVQLYAALDEEIKASGKAVSDLDRTMLSVDARNKIAHLNDLRQRYEVLLQATVESLETEGAAKAHAHFNDLTRKKLNALLFDTQTLVAYAQKMMQTELEQLQQSAASAKWLVILLSICASLVGTLLVWFIDRGIVTPVRQVVALTQSIASGNYSTEVPVGKHGEIGAMLRALSVMRDSIANREENILRLAYVDTLTKLPNRRRFMESFDARSGTDTGALVLFDINRFALINNALGYSVGDRLLCEFAARIRQATSGASLVARLGADQFALLLSGADHDNATAQVRQIIQTVHLPIMIEGQRLDIEASVGIVLYPQEGADTTTLLRRAHMALKSAKQRHASMAFGSELGDEPAHAQLSLLGEMREALAQGEFVIYYQPKLNLAQHKITAAEALIRWMHPVKGLIPPSQFIPFAEQTGFIREITPWVLRQVITDAAQWHRNGLAIIPSANLSTLDLLNPSLVTDIKHMLTQSDLPADHLFLEITESALMVQPELVLEHLNELAKFGVKLSIDDYGTGQSSLAYVKTLPVNELKIDRSFVTGVDITPKNAAIVRSTILLCQDLDLSIVAEGVETMEELTWLTNNQCDMVQGYIIAKPMPLNAFVEWVKKFNQL